MFAARPAAEIVARDQDRGAHISGIVEHIARLLSDRLERVNAEPLAPDRLEVPRGDDDVGVDIVAAERISAPLDPPYRPHATSSLPSASRPGTAAAPALAGAAHWVPPPGPGRPRSESGGGGKE